MNRSASNEIFFPTLLVTFVVSRSGDNMAQIDGRLYKRTKGRMYRSYFQCIETKCDAEVIVSDLKGGFMKVLRGHRPGCKNTSKDKVNLSC